MLLGVPALAQQLLTRHGIVTREIAASENLPGGFSAVYHVLKAMEDAGRVRRGYFVAGLGGALFASRNQFTGPEDHTLTVSINVLALVAAKIEGTGPQPAWNATRVKVARISEKGELVTAGHPQGSYRSDLIEI